MTKKYFVELTNNKYHQSTVGHGYLANVKYPCILTKSGDITTVEVYEEFEQQDMLKYALTEEEICSIDKRFMPFGIEVRDD